MKRPIFKNQEHDKLYLRNGYIQSNLLSSKQVEYLLEKILELKPDDNFSPDRKGASNYHCSFLDTNEEYKLVALDTHAKLQWCLSIFA